jgi:hypothetical protein
LPPVSDRERAGPAYTEFFRNVHPQPGPPFVPESFRPAEGSTDARGATPVDSSRRSCS